MGFVSYFSFEDNVEQGKWKKINILFQSHQTWENFLTFFYKAPIVPTRDGFQKNFKHEDSRSTQVRLHHLSIEKPTSSQCRACESSKKLRAQEFKSVPKNPLSYFCNFLFKKCSPLYSSLWVIPLLSTSLYQQLSVIKVYFQ